MAGRRGTLPAGKGLLVLGMHRSGTSALTRLLNHAELETVADLTVIAGDVEGESLWQKIKLVATDWFYGADHDLVVNTGSMSGGLRRPTNGARFGRDEGAQVNHFRYFVNEKSVRWLAAGLKADAVRSERRLARGDKPAKRRKR